MLGYPLTPLYGMMYIAVAIYVYYWMLKRLSRPMQRRWMQTNRSLFFLTMLGVMLLIVVIFILAISIVCVCISDRPVDLTRGHRQWCRSKLESGGGHMSCTKRHKNLVVPLHFLALQVQLVVLVSDFVTGRTVWSVSCLLFVYTDGVPRARHL